MEEGSSEAGEAGNCIFSSMAGLGVAWGRVVVCSDIDRLRRSEEIGT